MNNFFKYLTPGDEDKEWGLFLNTAGSYHAPPGEVYPPVRHPTGYYFTWENGRVLDEFQINYITQGSGIVETRSGKTPVRAGDIIIIKPQAWHRYKPHNKQGWQEQYIGFAGDMAVKLLSQPCFSFDPPVMSPGVRQELIDTYFKIFDLVHAEQPGFQQIASGLVIKMLGYLKSFETQKTFTGRRIATIIEDARFRIRQGVEGHIDMQQLACEYHIGYSWFRKMFRTYTGLSPHQYHLGLKIMRARELLLSTNMSVKEISFDLGFQSIHYFSRLFKSKTGKNPSEFRQWR